MTVQTQKAIAQAIDAMRVTQRLFGLPDTHLLMQRCRALETLSEEWCIHCEATPSIDNPTVPRSAA